MVRIAAFFAAGVLLCIFRPDLLSENHTIILFTVFSLSYFPVRFFLRFSRVLKLASGLIGLSAVAIAGYLTVLLRDESHAPDHLLQQKDGIETYRVKLITPAEEKAKSWKCVGQVQSILTNVGWRSVSGRINLYWPKEELVSTLDYGDILLIKGQPKEVEAAHNPYEFDFSEYLRFKNIHHQQFVRRGEWVLFQKSVDRGLLFYAHRARKASVSVFRRWIAAPQEQGILMALVLGVTDGLDNEILSAYSASGAMHVLAVSGLHVSIIYGILLFFFRPLRKIPGGEWAIALMSLMLLWGYAFITGLSPSVLRAVTMFSFVAIAKPMGRNTNIYNTLAASAFCLLLYDPFLLMSVGFQLSYLAVFGIVYLQRPLQNLWEAPNAGLHWVWQITTVSIAAQIATMALGIFYFHQFPVYFLLSNLFVIPASSLVLVGGILLLLLSPLDFIAPWLGMALEWLAKMMNEGIFLMERLPMSVIDRLSINLFQCYVLFLLILGGVMLIQFRKFKSLVFMFGCAAIFSFASWCDYTNKFHWIVYRIQGHRAMEWVVDGESHFVGDSSLFQDQQKIKFHIQPNQMANRYKPDSEFQIASQSLIQGLTLYRLRGRTFLWIQSKNFRLPKYLKVDYLIISNNSVKSLKQISDHLNFEKLILDSSNSYRYCEQFKKEAASMGVQFHSVLGEGAFAVSL